MATVLWLLIVIPSLVSAGAGNRWSYEGNHGPTHWYKDYQHCAGKRQSPVDVDTSDVQLDISLSQFSGLPYNDVEGITQYLENVGGHTVEVIYGGKSLIVNGGGLDGDFKVDQFHFHWGKVDARGSEHKINGEQYPMEMHIVHHSTQYANLTEALPRQNALAVHAFFIKAGAYNPNFEELLEHFENIEYAEDKVELKEPIKLANLLPADMAVFYRYPGSLTTPPCYETVTWTIFKTPIEISEAQLNKYRALKRTEEGEQDLPLVDDFRPLQSLNSRIIFTNDERGLSKANEISSCYFGVLVLSFIQIIYNS